MTRTARTAVTAAENAGCVDSYSRAKSLGIELEQEWMATLDVRTRSSHRKLDAAGVSKTEARKRLTAQLKEYGIPSGSFRKMGAGDQQKALDAALTRRKPTKTEVRRAGYKPVNESLYSPQKNYVKRHGGPVIGGMPDGSPTLIVGVSMRRQSVMQLFFDQMRPLPKCLKRYFISSSSSAAVTRTSRRGS